MFIGMLGPFEVRIDGGGSADVPGARLRGLLVALALRPGRTVSKAALVDWVWGDEPPAEATNALQRLVSRLRKVLPEGAIEGGTDGYRLTVAPDDVDAVRFERLVQASRTHADGNPRPRTESRLRMLREALELWRGPALQDVGPQHSAAFDAAVVRLENLRLVATEERVDAEVALGRGADMVTELTDLVAAHPLRERPVAALMRALVAAGRGSEALLVYQRAREALADALGVDPSPELAALHVALLRGELGAKPESRKTNLRAELTSFVGREADVEALRGLVSGHRLTTVIGPGGAGKTRLATEAARTMLGDLPDGVWLVELAAIGADGDAAHTRRAEAAPPTAHVAQATLSALGLRDALLGGSANTELTDRLIAAIRDREALLILDNCEHVVESAAVFAHRLLGECRRLRVLATSREPLGITGEALWRVEPLRLPAARAGAGGMGAGTAADIADSPAVRLLLDRARAVRGDLAFGAGTPAGSAGSGRSGTSGASGTPGTPGDPSDPLAVSPSPTTLATLAQICRALDGMPLAIELAAARLRTMSPEQLAGRLDDRFALLNAGSRTALPRHKTLRAVVDWSWELLTDAERSVLRRLSVFSGGATLEAAESVCAGDGVEEWQVLELLTALTEKSLVRTDNDAAPRYRMLGTIKEYAAGQLGRAGEAEAARHAHRDFFIALTEGAEPELRRAAQVTWLRALEAEYDNIGAAMRGALAAGEAQAAMRLAGGAGWYWWLAGHKTEAAELISAATRLPGEVTDDVRATVYALMVMFLTSGRGDEHQAAEWIRKAHEARSRIADGGHPLLGFIIPLERLLNAPETVVEAFEALLDDPDPWARALARLQAGKTRVILGRGGREADACLETALAEFRALGERYGTSFALTELAERIAVRGEVTAACAYFEEAIALVAELGVADDVIRMRARQAQLYWQAGDDEAATKAIADGERYAEGVTWPDALSELAFAKSGLARWRGDTAEASEQLRAAMALVDDQDEPNVRALTHHLLGYLAPDAATARAEHAVAYRAATSAGHPTFIAQILVGIADVALRDDDPAQAARLLAAATGLRGLPDSSHPDVRRIEREARSRLGDAEFAEAAREGADADWSQLAEVTLAR
ncbi:BTAD domain-containing putative transcriptional regulator [Yinghuangia aomiensis]